ncbi:MAG TPA: AMP-binding protein [Acidimicrobiales bacterium]
MTDHDVGAPAAQGSDVGALPAAPDAWRRHGFEGDPCALVAAGTLTRAWVARWAAAPAAPVLAGRDGRWVTAAELAERTAAVAARYAAAGLAPGDRLLVSAAPSVDLAVAHVAALRLGLVVVPVNTAFGAAEIGPVAAAARPVLAVLDDPARLPDVPSTGPDVALPGGPVPVLDAAAPGDTGLLVFTSGTTGAPKGVPLSHANLLASSASVEVAWRWTPDDRLVLALPLFHVHGLGVGLHGTLLAGASAVILPRFEVGAVLDAAGATGATLMFGVPTMWVRLAASSRLGELGALRLCVSGSAPLDPATFAALAEGIGSPVIERYGMTETGMLVSNPYEGERRAGSVGLALPGVEVRLEPRQGAGEPSAEILVRGPNVFGGYLGGVGADAFAGDGWFRTGDLGRADPDGYLRIVGRSKELIITGGYNVYPRDVEEVLRGHPGVADVAVVGVPDPEWGERVVACVVAGGPLDPGDLLTWGAERLAPYKRPREVRLVDVLPRNAMGKVVRAALVD